MIRKGSNLHVDAYSAFMDNTKNLMTEFDAKLKGKGIKVLYVANIATDVCVKATVPNDVNSNSSFQFPCYIHLQSMAFKSTPMCRSNGRRRPSSRRGLQLLQSTAAPPRRGSRSATTAT